MSHTLSASSESCTLTTFFQFFGEKKNRGPTGSQGAFSFSFFFFLLYSEGQTFHMQANRCVLARVCLCVCVGCRPLAHVRVGVRLRCSGVWGAQSSLVAARQILFLQIRVRPEEKIRAASEICFICFLLAPRDVSGRGPALAQRFSGDAISASHLRGHVGNNRPRLTIANAKTTSANYADVNK